jgi:type I restriction enzyme M protein
VVSRRRKANPRRPGTLSQTILPSSKGANLGFEKKLWEAADKLRSNMDAAEYKHVVLGLVFLKYISDAFNELHEMLKRDPAADPEDKDEYLAKRVFWVPKEARWDFLAKSAKQPDIGNLVDKALDAIERDNHSLRGVLVKDYTRPGLNKQRLGELIDLIGTIGLGEKEDRSKDILGRVYEYFLGQFANAEGKKGGQFYTPRSIVRLLVEMLEPYKGRILDPCCGSGGMFVQSEKFVEAHGGRIGDVSVFGQESNQTTWRLCTMNLAIRGIDAKISWGDSFREDQFKDLRADFILANPPFNDSDWGGELLQDDPRWKYGVPPRGNANFAWVQHFIHHLSPTGTAGFVLANGSMSSNTSSEGEIRKNIIETDLVDCMVALPAQLFYNTMIPACLWFVARDKRNNKFRDRRGQVLFIDARRMGVMIDRRHRELRDDDIRKISETYHTWRGEMKDKKYHDIPAFCKSASLGEVRMQQWILTPGRFVGVEEEKGDAEEFDERMMQLTVDLSNQMKRARDLDEGVKRSLHDLGFSQ